MAKGGLVVNLKIDNVRETLAVLRYLPTEANKELREASLKLSQSLSTRAKSAAQTDNRQTALLAPTVKARRDRVPFIQAGGAKRVGSRKKPAYKILFGSEFGSSRLRQFRPHLGRGSYWFFKTIENEQALINREWNAAADHVVDTFTKDGG